MLGCREGCDLYLMTSYGLPPRQGLYDPRHEHDACGIGFVADIKGRPSHKIVQQGLEVLVNLTHRGACGCDPDTGDGAGLLIQMPHEFFAGEAESLGFDLPAPGEYGVGMIFLSTKLEDQPDVHRMVERVVREEGHRVLGWRVVPTDSSAIGWLARDSEPRIEQVFIGKGEGSETWTSTSSTASSTPFANAPRRRRTSTASNDTTPAVCRRGRSATRPADRAADSELLSGLQQPEVSIGDRADPPALLDQHVSHVGTRAAVPLPGAQRRDQYLARQHQLDARS